MKSASTARAIVICALVSLLALGLTAPALAGPGPAPNAGDCIPDGSGLDAPFGVGLGGAPNSGDGIPDGSGF